MSRFKRLSHTVWHGEYHIVWVPKYRYRVMQGKVKEEVELCVREQSRQMNCEVQEMNVQVDHVHLIVQVPPKLAISEYMGRLKGKSIQPENDRPWQYFFEASAVCFAGFDS